MDTKALAATLPAVVRQLGYDTAPKFGPLWNEAEFVLKCLRRYLREENHGWAFGHSVEWVATEFAYFCSYDGTGEEHSALACLILSGNGKAIV